MLEPGLLKRLPGGGIPKQVAQRLGIAIDIIGIVAAIGDGLAQRGDLRGHKDGPARLCLDGRDAEDLVT